MVFGYPGARGRACKGSNKKIGLMAREGIMVRGINLAELPIDLQKKFKPKTKNRVVSKKMIVLGKVLQLFKGMDRREALWVLRRARKQFI